MGPRNFWIGLPVMLAFALVTIAGAYYALSQVYLEWQLERTGIPVQATLLKKYELADSERTTYHFRYSFQVDATTITNESRVDRDAYYSGREGQPLAVRYLPGNLERNLPAKREMSSFFKICGLISAIGAVFFLGVCFGMVVKKLRGGYRGA
jgi:hypothetical protein